MSKIIYPKRWKKTGTIINGNVLHQQHTRRTKTGFEYTYSLEFINGYNRAVSDIKKLNKE